MSSGFPRTGPTTSAVVTTTWRRAVNSYPMPGFSRSSSRVSLSKELLHSEMTLTCRVLVLFPIARRSKSGRPAGWFRARRSISSIPTPGRKAWCSGITCAACHTGELFYGDKAIRIDAGPSLIDLQKFTEALGLAVTWTYYDPLRFRRFAHRVLGPNPAHADSGSLASGPQILSRHQLRRNSKRTSISSRLRKATVAPTRWLESAISFLELS